MELERFFPCDPCEQPLDRPVEDGGFCGIFRRIACVGDSLSSGEFESLDENGVRGYHDYFDYSWGQYIARMAGCTVLNFSRGGMTAKNYCENFAWCCDYWNPDRRCQAYIIALGVNDILNARQEPGSAADICLSDWTKNEKTFAGYYGQIIQRYLEIEPNARFFLMTPPRSGPDSNPEYDARKDRLAETIRGIADVFENAYVLDFHRYAVPHDELFTRRFYVGGHLNAAGYLLTAKMTVSYIDYIIRHNITDFAQAGFIGTPYSYAGLKR